MHWTRHVLSYPIKLLFVLNNLYCFIVLLENNDSSDRLANNLIHCEIYNTQLDAPATEWKQKMERQEHIPHETNDL